MLYKVFEEFMIFWRNSVASQKELHRATLEMWYEQYFQYYSKEKFKKVILYLSENGIEVSLKNLLIALKEQYGYILHEEIAKALAIKKCKREKLDYSNLPLPHPDAIEYLKKEAKQ